MAAEASLTPSRLRTCTRRAGGSRHPDDRVSQSRRYDALVVRLWLLGDDPWTCDVAISRQGGVWVVGGEPLRGTVVDESLVAQPFDGSPLGSNITQGVPRRDQVGVVFVDQVLESSERPSPLQSLGQASAGRAVADAVGEVGHVLKPHVGGERVDDHEVQLIDLDGILPVDARVAGPERHLARARVDQPSVLVVSLIRQRSGDLLNVDSAQVEHPLRVGREPGTLEEAFGGLAAAGQSRKAR